MCDRFVAQAYGYLNSGSHTANAHWDRLVGAGLAHPGDHAPPPGALLFYDTGQPAGGARSFAGPRGKQGPGRRRQSRLRRQ
ncbi:hypothetical protein E1265_26095 [Streptomyces sp. 8K308]|uniref:hypothetical protein n=1 Tax=Streptomyces sp. 8K308 TaxID=2530388 RepID=UPI00104E1934|nr:hypothetical protein [Streptomyces sp. 8K308]TDC15885.1 hypothetical protein E1265_26095 [Streptomyces sp. 8K308]